MEEHQMASSCVYLPTITSSTSLRKTREINLVNLACSSSYYTQSQNQICFQFHQRGFSSNSFNAYFTGMALQEEFQQFSEKAKSLPATTKDADKLVLYGLYKQSTVGDVNTNRPGMFSPVDRAKWDAWKAVEGKTKEAAMAEYIAKVKEFQSAA